MCLVAEVLMVCAYGVVVCMHLWCVDPPWLMFPMDAYNVHFKIEKDKGKYALSSKRYELGEKNNLLDAHVSKLVSGPIK